AVAGLARLGAPATAALERGLHDPAADVREAAVEALGALWAVAPATELAARLGDERAAEPRWAAALALSRQAGAECGKEAARALDEAALHGAPGARLAARFARAAAGHPEAAAHLLRALRHGRCSHHSTPPEAPPPA